MGGRKLTTDRAQHTRSDGSNAEQEYAESHDGVIGMREIEPFIWISARLE